MKIKHNPIITSLLDNDKYKFTMMQAVYELYPNVRVAYKFKCRNGSGFPPNIDPDKFVIKIQKEIDNLCSLRFSKDEIFYLYEIGLKDSFVDYLSRFQLEKDSVIVTNNRGELYIQIAGLWLKTILFETPILSIITELFCRYSRVRKPLENARIELGNTLMMLCGIKEPVVSDFGTRRRWSKEWHEEEIEQIKDREFFHGTSNLYFAKKYNLVADGTMAHEWLMAHQQLGGPLHNFQTRALHKWADVFQGKNGIALSDCVGFDGFLYEFNGYLSRLYDGCRHDSGDPKQWGNKLIHHYNSYGIDPLTKTAIFSDGLNAEKILDLYTHFRREIKVGFGYGTNLTNNIPYFKPPSNVIKMVYCNDMPVAKLADDKGKGMCENENFKNYLKFCYGIRG